MFTNCTSFNGDISTWNTTNVTNMSYMFWPDRRRTDRIYKINRIIINIYKNKNK